MSNLTNAMFNNKKYRVGDYLINPELCLITREGLDNRLELRVMQVLVCLLERAGRPVSRDELIKEVWRGGVVSDNAINRIIAQLRIALGDDAKAQKVIKTVPKVGYLLTAVIEPLSAAAVPERAGVGASQPDAALLERSEPSDSHSFSSDPRPLTSEPRSLSVQENPPMRRKGFRQSLIYASLGICLPILLLWGWDSYQQWLPDNGEMVELAEEIVMLEPLTSLDGQEVDPVLSPDGSSLAYAYRELDSRQWRIMTLDRQTGQIQFVAGDANTLNQRFPAWSDDGGHLAFMQFNGRDQCQIMLLDLLTKSVKSVAHCHPSSQSGSLAIKGQTLFYVDSDGVDEIKKIYRVNLKTLRRDQLSLSHSLGRGDYGLSLSPDKQRLAVLRNLGWFDTQIMLFDFASGEWKTALRVGYPLKSVAWTADGHGLIYRAEEGQLHQLSLVDDKKTRVTKILQEVNSPRSNELGQSVAVVGELIEEALWLGTLADSAEIHPTPWVSSSRRDYRGVISRDGSVTAFVSNRTGLPQIWLKHADGREVKLSHFSRFSFIDELTFSPDGNAIAGTINGEGFIFNIASGKFKYIPGRKSVRNISFGKNSDEVILFSVENNKGQLLLVSVDSGKLIKLLVDDGFSGKFDVTSGKLYFTKAQTKGIWTLSHGQDVLVTEEVTPAFAGAWSVVQGKIWYLINEAGSLKLVKLNPATAERYTYDIAKTSVSANTLSVTENGKVLFSVLNDANSDVVLLK